MHISKLGMLNQSIYGINTSLTDKKYKLAIENNEELTLKIGMAADQKRIQSYKTGSEYVHLTFIIESNGEIKYSKKEMSFLETKVRSKFSFHETQSGATEFRKSTILKLKDVLTELVETDPDFANFNLKFFDEFEISPEAYKKHKSKCPRNIYAIGQDTLGDTINKKINEDGTYNGHLDYRVIYTKNKEVIAFITKFLFKEGRHEASWTLHTLNEHYEHSDDNQYLRMVVSKKMAELLENYSFLQTFLFTSLTKMKNHSSGLLPIETTGKITKRRGMKRVSNSQVKLDEV